MNHLLKQSSLGLAVTFTSWLAGAPAAQQTPELVPHKVQPSEQIRIAPVQASLTELARLSAAGLTPPVEPSPQSEPIEIPVVELGSPAGKTLRSDAGTTTSAVCTSNNFFLSAPTQIHDFDGQLDDGTTSGFSYAPNASGGVGPNHLFSLSDINGLIQDKSGATVLSLTAPAFWTPVYAGPLLYTRVSYDNVSDRWIATARSGVATPTYTMRLLLAVSVTDDPTGFWNYYSINPDVAATTFPDWTPHGYNANWITISANQFNVVGGASVGAKMWVCDKAAALAGAPLTISVFGPGWTAAVHGSGGSSPMPTRDMDGSSSTMYLLNDSFTSSNIFLLQISQITGTGVAPVVSAIAGSPFGGTTSFHFVSIPFSATQRTMAQVGDARFISPFSIRMASALVRNGKIWAANNAGLPGLANNAAPTSNGLLWYQLDPSLAFAGSSLPAPNGMLLQNGSVAGAVNTMQMIPSIAVNCAEDMILGFSNGDATKNPEASYVFRRGSDAVSTTGPISLIAAGLSSYWKTLAGTTAPWGLGSSAAVDPNDDSALWTLQQYAGLRVGPLDTDSRWATRWGRLGFAGAISDQPDDIADCVGNSAVFQVVASSPEGPLSYQWRKDGSDLPGEINDTLTIATTVVADAGSYDCIVTDQTGSTLSDAATLAFNEPTINTQPVNATAAVGGSASFSVVATGSGTVTYQWELDGNAILGANSDTYSIAATVKADYGLYTCVVTDDCGFVESSAAALKLPLQNGKAQVGALSFQILTHPASQIGCLDQSVSFTVQAAGNNVTYQWRKNFADMPGEVSSTLTLSGLTAGDSAFYDVTCTSGSQVKHSFPAFLTLTDEPVITVQPSPSSQTVSPGATVTYSVTATGLNLSYQWRFRSPVPFSPFVDMPGETNSTLNLDPVTPANQGSYRCRIQNLCGSTLSSIAQLFVF